MSERPTAFRRKRPEEIAVMARAGRILGDCLHHVASLVEPGVTTASLDVAAETFIRDHGCVPSFLGYRGFPMSICISVNDECVHGIPGQRRIADGDLVSLDCGLILDGWQSDSGMSVACGEADDETSRLLRVTQEALYAGIAATRAGNHVGDIGAAVQARVAAGGFSTLRDFGGHGIGQAMHEPPEISNRGRPGWGNELRAGLVVAIEPIVNAGTDSYRLLDDGWTVVTADGRRSCYFEHTVAVTEAGPWVLSARRGEALGGLSAA